MAITTRKAFGLGAVVGVGTALVVVFADAVKIFNTPLWQQVLLFPGFAAGAIFYRLTSADDAAVWVGVVAMGMGYGLVAVVLRYLVVRLRHDTHSVAPSSHSL